MEFHTSPLRALLPMSPRTLIGYYITLLQLTLLLPTSRHSYLVPPQTTGTIAATSPRLMFADAKDVKSVRASLELQCPSCERIHCSPRRVRKLDCVGGITTGICNCCPICAKVEGEKCGGVHQYLGKCDRGLYCKADHSPSHSFMDMKPNHKRKAAPIQGICTKAPADKLEELKQMDQPLPRYCKPKCTPSHCTKNPKAICSALDNTEKVQSCQGECQHTSCRACRFVEEEPACAKCNKDDFGCLKKFGTCMKNLVCSRRKHPCRKNMMQSGAKFQCIVPECLMP